MKNKILLTALVFGVLSLNAHGDEPSKKDKELMQITDKFRSNPIRLKDFEPKGDVVLDKRTGLTWMRCSVGRKWDGKTCTGEAKKVKWKDAKKTCESLGGKWRLPSIWELETLVYCSSGKDRGRKKDLDACKGKFEYPTLVKDAFVDAKKKAWSSTPCDAKASKVFYVYFREGNSLRDNQTFASKKPVRCVR